MRTGLLARADIGRGLANMSVDAQQFLSPTATLVVDADQGYPMHLDLFPNAPVVHRSSVDFRKQVDKLLDQIDVLLVLETPYNFELFNWARDKSVRTILVAMPEYHSPYLDLPQPDLIVNPTPYMHEMFPNGIVLPWPVNLYSIAHRPRTHITDWLHVVGQVAHHDRAGTELVVAAFAQLPDQHLILRVQSHQDPRLRRVLRLADRLPNVTVLRGQTISTYELFEEGDALIAPRRYAGQSLPSNEAAAAGLPLVCLDRIPDAAWTLPELRIPTRISRVDGSRSFEIFDADVRDVVRVVELLSGDDALVARASAFSRARAEAMSWDTLLPVWRDVITAVGEGRDPADVLRGPPATFSALPSTAVSRPS